MGYFKKIFFHVDESCVTQLVSHPSIRTSERACDASSSTLDIHSAEASNRCIPSPSLIYLVIEIEI